MSDLDGKPGGTVSTRRDRRLEDETVPARQLDEATGPTEVIGLHIEDPYGCFESEHADDAPAAWMTAGPTGSTPRESMFTFVPYTPAPPSPPPAAPVERWSHTARRMVAGRRTAVLAALRRAEFSAVPAPGVLRRYGAGAAAAVTAVALLAVLAGLPGRETPAAVRMASSPPPTAVVAAAARTDDAPTAIPASTPPAAIVDGALRAEPEPERPVAAPTVADLDVPAAPEPRRPVPPDRTPAAARPERLLSPVPRVDRPAAGVDAPVAEIAERRPPAEGDEISADAVPAAPDVAAVAPPVPSALPTEIVPPPVPARSDRLVIQDVLNQYRDAYNALDPSAARAVWPTVDMKALGRAFDRLQEQEFALRTCEIDVRGTRAVASCAGTLRYVPKVGSRTSRVERREWEFSLRAANDRWLIDKVVAR